MKDKKNLYLSILSTVLLTYTHLHAMGDMNQTKYKEWSVRSFDLTKDKNVTESQDWIVAPVAFATNATGLFGGIAVIKEGLFQPQTTLVASVFYGVRQDVRINGIEKEKNFSGGFISFSDFKLPYTERLFFSFNGLKSYFPKKRTYIFGSNDSNRNAVIKSAGDVNYFNTAFRYVLPIGEGLDNPGGVCALQDGFALGRQACGNDTPILTGRTSIGLKTFYQYENTENTLIWRDPVWWEHGTSKPTWSTNGLRVFLAHDNTDFNLNPSRGYQFGLQYSRDFAWEDSLQSWDALSAKYNHYYNLDTFSFSKQNVLALSLWTAYSFSWENDKEITAGINAHRPPTWEGARLGGLFRMRAYDQNRFSDKAAFYATAEYRTIIDYNPLKHQDMLPNVVDWFQVVGFVEAGRVHDQYDFDLLSNMKVDVGISLRAMVAELPVRLDVALGTEGTNMWLMVNQPFDF